MSFFTNAIDVLQTLVIALGGGLCVWGGINLLEGYGQDNNMENFETYYDEIEICGSAASSHPKGAFQIRNRQMVKRSNLVVFYVDHTGGGAYQTMRYAQKEKKNILNLAGEGYGEKE